MKTKCPAKINLFLNIINKRTDGYHNLVLINQTVSLFDTLNIKINKKNNKINITCNDKQIPTNETNSIYKAINEFKKIIPFNEGLNIKLTKRIPTESGLGGESTDAAKTLILLNKLFKSNLTTKELEEIAINIGSDTPYLIKGGFKLVKEKGNIIEKLDKNPYKYYLILIPNFKHSTKEMFKKYELKNKYKKVKQTYFYNDFEKVVEENFKKIKKDLINKNIKNLSMSGSGSSLIIGFKTKKEQTKTYKQLKNEYKLIKCKNY